jgi:peptidoglycan/xylan/chitin deacetylase (PgdA/CDA1 family)
MKSLLSFGLLLLWAASEHLSAQTRFPWPEGKRVAVSLSFDDARESQAVNGFDLFARHCAKVTFYVNPRSMEKHIEKWKRAAAQGHEIGSHSDTHPCSGNFPFARKNALEEYTLAKLEADLNTADRDIQRLLGLKATTFAYPCGSKFVGRGVNTQSYVPVIAKRFRAGRGFRDEAANDPAYVDLAQTLGVDSDGMTFEQMKDAVLKAAQQGGWLVFAGHNIGNPGNQTTEIAVLEEFLRYARDPANGIWLDTVDAIASYIQKHRTEP